MARPIYLDHNATTPVDPRVAAAMQPWLTEKFGNPSSRSHAFGWEAKEAVERGRAEVAAALGARPEDLVFTSGATESDNLALQGVLQAEGARGDHLVTVASEHHAVLDTARWLEGRGVSVTVLGVGADGLVDLDALSRAVGARTALVSVMAVNNEIGVVQPLAEIGRLCRARGALFHTDAAQAIGRIAIDVEAMQLDLVSVTAHKAYGPKGIGALYVRRQPKFPMAPLMHGGGQERGLRSGTLPAPLCVGIGRAFALAVEAMPAERERLRVLRDGLLAKLLGALDLVHVHGSLEQRVTDNLNVSFAGVEAEELMLALAPIAVSSGAACTSGTAEPSHVLRALGASAELAHASVRFGLGRFNGADEVEEAAARVVREVQRLRGVASPGAGAPLLVAGRTAAS